MEIRGLGAGDLAPAMDMVWRVFSEFEAPDYGDEGIAEFRGYIDAAAMERRVAAGEIQLWGSFDGARIVGVVATRPPAHLSLLFVDAAHHRRGIARALLETAKSDGRRNNAGAMTVHSSPYAVEAYRRMGFSPTGPEQTENGLRFIPMRCPIE